MIPNHFLAANKLENTIQERENHASSNLFLCCNISYKTPFVTNVASYIFQ